MYFPSILKQWKSLNTNCQPPIRLWVADAAIATPQETARFLAGSVSGRMIVLGARSDGWDDDRVTFVDGTAGVQAVQAAISGILSQPAGAGR